MKQGSTKHSSGNQKDNRQGDCGNHKDAVETSRAPGDTARPNAQLLFQIAKWCAHGRRESKKRPAQRGNAKGKQKHVPIEANFFRTRQSTRPHLYKRPDAVRRDKHAEQSSDRKSTRLNSSHVERSYAVFCLKKKTMRAVRDE